MEENNISIEELDSAIKKALNDLIKESKSTDKPISLNIQFSDDDSDENYHEEIENIVYDKNKMILTLYTPYVFN